MKVDKVIKKEITINADVDLVWDALVNPEKIKLYLFGTNVTSDWKPGSEIVFEGEYNGIKYRDHGVILGFKLDKLFQYTYWSSMSDLEDKPENTSRITFELEYLGDTTKLILTQDQLNSEKQFEDSNQAWEMVLPQLKEVVEKSVANE